MGGIYDVVIIGGGPSGLTAALYACRARMKTILVEKMLCGGQVLIADRIENYPGFPGGVKGPELAEWMSKQAEHFGLETRTLEAKHVLAQKSDRKHFVVETAEGEAIKAKAVIIATGARWSSMNIPGEKELSGRGVSYCATCDGPLFRGREVVVVGGGDTAIEDALFLTKFADKVIVVHRRDKLRATKILQERAFANPKIIFKYNSVPVEVCGKEKVDSILIKNVHSGAGEKIKTDGVFVLIGATPNSGIVSGLVKLDDKGHVLTDDDMKTSLDGVFACGDVRKKLLRQVVTAAGDGAVAAFSAEHYIEGLPSGGK